MFPFRFLGAGIAQVILLFLSVQRMIEAYRRNNHKDCQASLGSLHSLNGTVFLIFFQSSYTGHVYSYSLVIAADCYIFAVRMQAQ